jgi:hypothetical protein
VDVRPTGDGRHWVADRQPVSGAKACEADAAGQSSARGVWLSLAVRESPTTVFAPTGRTGVDVPSPDPAGRFAARTPLGDRSRFKAKLQGRVTRAARQQERIWHDPEGLPRRASCLRIRCSPPPPSRCCWGSRAVPSTSRQATRGSAAVRSDRPPPALLSLRARGRASAARSTRSRSQLVAKLADGRSDPQP